MMARLMDEYSFLDIIPISAINDEGVAELEKLIYKYLPENEHIYSEEGIQTSHKDMFMISELIREKIIRMLGDELPHDTFVQVELLENEEKLIKIHAVIYVVRDSQKQIVIGRGGSTLKRIGQQARIELEEYFDKKVFLKTWVKVKKNWNSDSDYIQSLGVGGSYES
jgi:GTP-binding protein Era